MRRQSMAPLPLPVPRTFDLTHVQPAHFAVALGQDPVRIFEFVRDQIAYEAYTGALRGPRGTLIAMAGNSVDRAALLGSLLESAGQRVRYAKGTLPDREAAELVSSIWAKRPPSPRPEVEGNVSPGLSAAAEALPTSVKRDYLIIRDQLKKARTPVGSDAASSFDSLVTEARPHYWIQWMKDGKWIDLDPSFGDATQGRTYARLDGTLDILPDDLFHRVTLRIRVEEYTGSASAGREILTYSARAADLSAVGLLLVHQPENWKGPAGNLQEAISSAVEDTGRVKPVLLIEDRVITGEPFRQKLKTRGIGAIPQLLGGGGTRKDVPIAVAEWIEIDLIAPGGHPEQIVREIYDLVGKARRASGQSIDQEKLRALTSGDAPPDVTRGIFDLFFTTGRVDAEHLSRLAEDPAGDEGLLDLSTLLRRINVTFAATSDGILDRLGRADRAIIHFYPDSPRLVIAEISAILGTPRMVLDLRRDHARAVVIGSRPEDVVAAQILRGVADGTLERTLIEYVTTEARELGWGSFMSTSLLFEKAQTEGVSMTLLGKESTSLGQGVSDDVIARLREETTQGYLLVAPQRAVTIAGVSRFAWWRIDPRSGATTAVTDEGLHQMATEYRIVEDKKNNKVTVVARSVDRSFGIPNVSQTERTFQYGSRGFFEYIDKLIAQGGTLVEDGFWIGR